MGPPSGSRSSIGRRVLSFVRDFLPKPDLGQVWEGPAASQAYQDGSLHSKASGNSIRIAFRNLSTVPLLLCWVSENGDLNHFYKLPPSSGLIGFSDRTVTEGDHIEHSCGGHAFCIAQVPENQIKEAKRLKSLQDTSSIIGGYIPFQDCDEEQVHLVTICRGRAPEEKQCCVHRKRLKATFVSDNGIDDDEEEGNRHWRVRAQVAQIDPTPYDTSTKVYELRIVGGWPVYAEPNWFDENSTLERRLAQDLQKASKILPRHAVEYLRQNCPIWVNSSIKFGPKACPIEGTGCCYHPDKEWLVENGMSVLKHKCIEINDGPGYMDGLNLWGVGGVMVHEFSHAYHHRMLNQGYDNKEILACYKKAMKEGLYDNVKVHGPQGPEAKAYACTNDKEYFAELSTAFLGGTDDRKEYNKWYPFNRAQLRTHDPRAYALLCRLWKVQPK